MRSTYRFLLDAYLDGLLDKRHEVSWSGELDSRCDSIVDLQYFLKAIAKAVVVVISQRKYARIRRLLVAETVRRDETIDIESGKRLAHNPNHL